MAVPVTAAGTSFDAGTPVALCPTRILLSGWAVRARPATGRVTHSRRSPTSWRPAAKRSSATSMATPTRPSPPTTRSVRRLGARRSSSGKRRRACPATGALFRRVGEVDCASTDHSISTGPATDGIRACPTSGAPAPRAREEPASRAWRGWHGDRVRRSRRRLRPSACCRVPPVQRSTGEPSRRVPARTWSTSAVCWSMSMLTFGPMTPE